MLRRGLAWLSILVGVSQWSKASLSKKICNFSIRRLRMEIIIKIEHTALEPKEKEEIYSGGPLGPLSVYVRPLVPVTAFP